MHRVYLIPGFFGFSRLGDLPYFAHVEDRLRAALSGLGIEAEIVAVHQLPTASLRRRAARLLEVIAETAGDGDDPIHLIGHSSGGLDARLLVSPGVDLPVDLDVEAYARRVKSVVTIAAPHRGTPVASFFTGVMGDRLLRLFSLSTSLALRYGRLPLGVVTRLAGVFHRVRTGRLLDPSAIEQMYSQVLTDFDGPNRDLIEQFLAGVQEEQALLPQLTVDGVDVFNAGTATRPGVSYACVLTAGPPPGLSRRLKVGIDPYAQATHMIYRTMYRLSVRSSVRADPEVEERVRRAFSGSNLPAASDGVVPTASQVFGEIAAAVRADHLDVIGYFDDPHGEPRHHDWLCSASGFTRADFERLWDDIAASLHTSVWFEAPSLPRPLPAQVIDHRLIRRARSHVALYLAIGVLGFTGAFVAASWIQHRLGLRAGSLGLLGVWLACAILMVALPTSAYEQAVRLRLSGGAHDTARALSILRGLYQSDRTGEIIRISRRTSGRSG